MKLSRTIMLLLVMTAFLASCSKNRPHKGDYDTVVVYYGIGYNDLSYSLQGNVNELTGGMIPYISEGKALLVFSHSTARYGDYSTPSQPTLTQLYRKNGAVVCDTLIRYPASAISASGNCLRGVLEDVKTRFPSKGYGLIMSSHSTGWIPPGYTTASENSISQLSIGAQFHGSAKNIYEMETAEFAGAFPMKMDFIIMDVCLASCIEIAYQLRNVCGTFVASPAEVLTRGFIYNKMGERLFGGSTPDIKGICTDFYDYYNSLSGVMRSGTIAMVDCSETEDVAQACAAIYRNHRKELDSVYRGSVQKYFYNNLFWFYDLRDLAVNINASQTELKALDNALEKCVLYHAETPMFNGMIKFERCCGLSTYIPYKGWGKLNAYYRTLDWNRATGLVE